MEIPRLTPPAYPFAKIRDLWLEVAHSDFFHSHLGEPGILFLGRKKAKERLKMLLRYSKSRSGAYLVTGFRGMGKTSLVHEALRELQKECEHERPYEKIAISLSQDDVRDMDVLRLIARQLASKWKELYIQKSIWHKVPPQGVWTGILCILVTLLFTALWPYWHYFDFEWRKEHYFYPVMLVALVSLVALFINYGHHSIYRKVIGLKDYQGIKRRLDFLNIRLDSMLTQEKGISVSPEAKSGWGLKFSLFSASSRDAQSFKIATAKEIEKELIGIFKDIEEYRRKKEINWPLFRAIRHVPEFVFILDELDKIEPDFITLPSLLENNQHAATVAPNVQRRETIARLLSNLKSFLNEAKAKFIFIGGREMYDASLADIADRDSFYGSIFHGVIYVNSFFKDKIQHRAGVTRMTEAYLCHLLIPQWYMTGFVEKQSASKKGETDLHEWYNLGTLYHYLVDCQSQATSRGKAVYHYGEAIFDHSGDEKLTPPDRAAVYKILYQLQNFVIYLAYRSNGTPKKLVGLLEHYILPGIKGSTPGDGQTGSFICDLGFNPQENAFGNEIILFCPPEPGKALPQNHDVAGKMFLKFTFNQQYEIGLTSNFYRPYSIIHSRHLKSLGDKLLYSTSYIMDYILKFHPHGFSWRNLEMIPDVILTNKEPNLRYFMQELMQFLMRMHIRETGNGMFQFRFYNKVVNEIRYLSKISEQGAAAFNFTIDESQQIKHYYRDKLNKQLMRHQEPVRFSKGAASPNIYSITFLHNLLGDLHYYEKEYDDAIIHYSDAAQPLRERAVSGTLSNHQVALLVRTQLKLGMAMEKMQAFDPAYSIYRSLIMDMPRFLRLQTNQTDDKGDNKLFAMEEDDRPMRRMQLLVRPYIAILDLVEKQRIDGVTFSNLRRNLIDLNILLDENRPYPILESRQETRKTDKSPKDEIRLHTLYADYFNNVGSILYFKNHNFPQVYESFKHGLEGGPENQNTGFRELQQGSLAEFMKHHRGRYKSGKPAGQTRPNYDYNPSLSSYIYYRQALYEQFASFKENLFAILEKAGDKEQQWILKSRENDLVAVQLLLHPEVGYLTNNMQKYIIGNLFTKLGDAVLGSAGGNVKPLSEAVLEIYENDRGGDEFKEHLEKCLRYFWETSLFDDCFNAALILYRIAGFFYLKSNRAFSHAFQFKKFLFVIKDWLAFRGKDWVECVDMPEEEPVNGKEERLRILKRLEKLLIDDSEHPGIANRLLHSITWTADVSNRPQLLKYREIFHVGRTQDTLSIYSNISTSPETREVVLLIEEIRLKLYSLGVPGISPKLNLITPYDSITSRYLRVFELKYKCEYNYAILKDLHAEKLLQANYYKDAALKTEFGTTWDLIKDKGDTENCILDSIFCLYEVIRSLNVYGFNYVTNHSFLANAHYKLANWCRAFENLKAGYRDFEAMGKENASEQQINDKLVKLLGTDALYALEPNYHDEQAIEHYYSAIQTHNGGRSYRDNVVNMSFLEDDLNDNLTHFSAAAERFRVNTGVIRNKIEQLKLLVGKSQVYDFESYTGEGLWGD